MRQVIYMFFLCLLSVNVFAQKDKKDTVRTLDPAADYFKAASKLQDSMRYKEAIKLYEKAVKKRNNFPEAYNKMAFCFMELKDFANAQKNLELTLKYNPDNFNCTKYLGRVCYLNKKYPEAKKYYDEASGLDPADPELMCFIAELRAFGQDDKGAIELYNQVLFAQENYALAYLDRGLLKYKLKQYSYAIKDIEQGIKLFRYTNIEDEVYTNLAQAKFETGDYKGAIKVFDTLIKRNSKNEFAYTYRGAAKIEVNDFSAAISDLEEAIKLNSKSYIAYNFRGTAKGGLKQYIEALKDFDYAIKLKFNYPSTYVNRAAVKMASKDRKGACEDLTKADQLGSDVAYKLIQQYCGGTDY
ncbi:MAG TPA: tetratricopeptide repeat protein [Bacteroidia bacterium]|jgi:tetratricopeptide (TPR) repeat protein|nr:tetratricopeptide repeat protein [Bacteroidia bacterium]